MALSDISRKDIELAKTLAHNDLLIDGANEKVFGHIDEFSDIDLEFAKQLVEASWIVDGVTEEENQSLFGFPTRLGAGRAGGPAATEVSMGY